jgi:cytidine deaminase
MQEKFELLKAKAIEELKGVVSSKELFDLKAKFVGKNGEITDYAMPCGACRQVILETEKRYNKAMRIILYGTKECYVIEDGVKALLPLSFDAGFLE